MLIIELLATTVVIKLSHRSDTDKDERSCMTYTETLLDWSFIRDTIELTYS